MTTMAFFSQTLISERVFMKRIFFPVLLISVLFAVSTSRAQTPTYYGALLYSMPIDTNIPPLYLGQPSSVTTAYLWLDEAMRVYKEYQILAYIRALSLWNDTTETLASCLYQIQDDNPLTYYNWDGYGTHTPPYTGVPGQSEFAFIKQAWALGGTRPGALLSSEIIADVTISDTVCTKDPTAISAKDAVLAKCVINDEIKGKWVPACPGSLIAGKTGPSTLGVATSATSATPADTARAGTCLQFEYSPEWKKNASDDLSPNLGWWVKPGQEYMVFLFFAGIGSNSSHDFFSTYPVSFGHSGGMYPVVGGIVQDPYDDFHFGSTSLTVAEWKAALRAKISALVTP
jgi:hypothetical protein